MHYLTSVNYLFPRAFFFFLVLLLFQGVWSRWVLH